MSNVRRLRAGDHATWKRLWRDYCAFYRAPVDAKVREATFKRLCAGAEMLGLVAVGPSGRPIGLAHLVFHRSTWSASDYCYLEDLFVTRAQRGNDVARALIEGVYAEADARGAGRVYWHTQEFNAPARSLYDTLARRTSFIEYRR